MSSLLLVGPFPSAILKGGREELLKHYGAESTIHKKKGQKENYIIGKFKSFQACQYAMKNIHQMKVLNRRLIAKYFFENFDLEQHKNALSIGKEQEELSSKVKAALRKYEANISAISSRFDVNFPISPHLRYNYPPASMEILDNISVALMTHVKLYTQVLHLMNKMNLPSPFQGIHYKEFSEGLPAMQISSVVCNKQETIPCDESLNKNEHVSSAKPDRDVLNIQNMSESETSSELESDEEWKQRQNKEMPKRIRKQKITINKRMKLEDMKKTLKPDIERERENVISESAKDAFDVSFDVSQSKKFEVKLQSRRLSDGGEGNKSNLHGDKSDLDDTLQSVSGFGKLFPTVQDISSRNDESHKDISSKSNYIELNQLELNRVSKSDWPMLLVFKNYSPGIPSRKLYLKNIAKTVTEGDLKYIFGRFVCWEFTEEATSFNIQLMRGGRMKGQGFITFFNEEAATKALKETNGYILKDKPIVVMFSKLDKDGEKSVGNVY